jgi:hypothetical protein
MVIAHGRGLRHQHVDRNAGPRVLPPIRAGRLRQLIVIDLEQHHVAAIGLRGHMRFESAVGRQFVLDDAVEQLEVR